MVVEASARVRACLVSLYDEDIPSATTISKTVSAFQQLFTALLASGSSKTSAVESWATTELSKLIDFLLRDYFGGDLSKRVNVLQFVLACWRTRAHFDLAKGGGDTWSKFEQLVIEAVRDWCRWLLKQKLSAERRSAFAAIVGGMLGAFQELTIIGYRFVAREAEDETVCETADILLTLLEHLPLPSSKNHGARLVAGLSPDLSIKEAHQRALAAVAFNSSMGASQRCQLAAILTSARLRDLSAPLLFAPLFIGIVRNENMSLESRMTATAGIFDLMVEHRLGSEGASLVAAFYDLIRPELFAVAGREKALECLTLLSKTLAKSEAVFFIKRALRVATLVPAHAALWLIAFAKVIFGRHPSYCLPMLQFDAPLVTEQTTDIHGSLPPRVVVDDKMEESEIPAFTAAVAQNSLYELELLERHANKNVASSAAAFHTEVFDLERRRQAKEDLQSILNISGMDICNKACYNTLSRCVKGILEVTLDDKAEMTISS